MRQLVRHRTANINEYSGRYSVMSDEFYLPQGDYLQKQSTTNNQGRGEELESKGAVQFEFNRIYDNANGKEPFYIIGSSGTNVVSCLSATCELLARYTP